MAITILSGLVLTVASYTWMLVILETIAKRLPFVTHVEQVQVLFGVAALTAVVAIVWRARAANRIPAGPWRALAYTHAGAIGFLTTYVVVSRPASRTTPWPSLPDACTPAPIGACGLPPAPDVAATIVIASTLSTLILGGLAWICCVGREAGTARLYVAHGPGSALAMMLALLGVHAIGSALRLATDWLLVYVFGFFDPRTTRPPSRVLLLLDEKHVQVYLLDTVASYAVTAMVVVLVSVYLSSVLRQRGRGVPEAPRSVRKANRRHRAVLGLPRGLPMGIALGMALTALSVVTIYHSVFVHSEHAGELGYAAVVIATHAAAAAAAVFMLLGRRSPLVRKVLGLIADVLGFWDVRTHPLAGRSYRREIVEGLTAELDRHSEDPDARSSLVGHSQGSVLCAWVVSERARTDATSPHIQLVTCGSPLSSLYATFFPTTFDNAFFTRARRGVGRWDNYWRITDPIATSLPAPEEDQAGPPSPPSIANRSLDDPWAENVHSDYWLEPLLVESVSNWLGETPRKPADDERLR
jgi:hypothetical protein